MTDKIRILFLSANPWTTSRILVDEEAREIFEKLQEGSYRERFDLQKHSAIRSIDLQRLLMKYQPHIVHFSGHASKKQKIILGGFPGRGRQIDRQGLVEVFALYKDHVRLVFLNACFTKTQASSLSEVLDYCVGAGKAIGDKGSVAFAGAFYRALAFGKSIRQSFESAKAELALTKIPRTKGIELFVRAGLSEADPFPQLNNDPVSDAEQIRSASLPLTRPGRDYALMRDAENLVQGLSRSYANRAGRRSDQNRQRNVIQTPANLMYAEAHMTVTVQVRKVFLMESAGVSQAQIAREHQTARIRANLAGKRIRRDGRRESAARINGSRKSPRAKGFG